MRFAKRLDPVPPYLFAEIERRIEAKRRRGRRRDQPRHRRPRPADAAAVIEALAARRRATRRRTSTRRTTGSTRSARRRRASTRDRFGVELDPATRGDPRPRRQGGGRATSRSPASTRATSRSRPTRATRRTRRARSSRAPRCTTCRSRRRTRSCPTSTRSLPRRRPARTCSTSTTRTTRPGRSSRDGFFERAVAFAREHDLIVVHDNAYSEIAFDGYRAAELPRDAGREGRRRRDLLALQGLEHDRLAHRAWIAGNAEVVERYRQLKTNLDSGMFEALQRGRRSRRSPTARTSRRRCRRSTAAGATSCSTRSRRSDSTSSRPGDAVPLGAACPRATTRPRFTELVLEQAAVVVSPGPVVRPERRGLRPASR